MTLDYHSHVMLCNAAQRENFNVKRLCRLQFHHKRPPKRLCTQLLMLQHTAAQLAPRNAPNLMTAKYVMSRSSSINLVAQAVSQPAVQTPANWSRYSHCSDCTECSNTRVYSAQYRADFWITWKTITDTIPTSSLL